MSDAHLEVLSIIMVFSIMIGLSLLRRYLRLRSLTRKIQEQNFKLKTIEKHERSVNGTSTNSTDRRTRRYLR